MNEILIYTAVFTVAFFGDFCWAKWQRACQDHRAYHAANWSCAIFFSSIAYVYFVAEQHWGLLAIFIVGSYVGTVSAIKHGEKYEDR